MDQIELQQKIKAIKTNQNSTSSGTTSIMVCTVAALVCSFILTSPLMHWLPSVIWPILSIFCSGKPFLFILGNLIVLFLVGQSKITLLLLPNHSTTNHDHKIHNSCYSFKKKSCSSSMSISSPAAAPQANEQYCSFPSVANPPLMQKVWERKQENEEDYYCSYDQYQSTTSLSSSTRTTGSREDELTKRADDFIAKVNRLIWIDCYVNN